MYMNEISKATLTDKYFTSTKVTQNSLELFTRPCLCATIPHIVCLFIEEENVKLDVLTTKWQLETVFNL